MWWGGVVNNQIKKGFIAEFVSKRLKSVNIWQLGLQARTLLSRAHSSSSAVCWPGVPGARDNHVLACNNAKYSPTFEIFFTDRLSNKLHSLVINNHTTP